MFGFGTEQLIQELLFWCSKGCSSSKCFARSPFVSWIQVMLFVVNCSTPVNSWMIQKDEFFKSILLSVHGNRAVIVCELLLINWRIWIFTKQHLTSTHNPPSSHLYLGSAHLYTFMHAVSWTSHHLTRSLRVSPSVFPSLSPPYAHLLINISNFGRSNCLEISTMLCPGASPVSSLAWLPFLWFLWVMWL